MFNDNDVQIDAGIRHMKFRKEKSEYFNLIPSHDLCITEQIQTKPTCKTSKMINSNSPINYFNAALSRYKSAAHIE